MMPACQPPLGAPAAFPPRAVQSGLLLAAAGRASRVDSLLLAVFNEEDVRGELLSAMSLQSKRASCCCCSTLRSYVSADLHAPSLAVRIEDANLHNAAFVARLPRLGTLHVQGETFLSDGIDLNKLRSLNRIAVGQLSFEASLFVGAVLSGGEHTLRLSGGACVALHPLRTRERVNLTHHQLRDKDLAVLLGALSLNPHLKKLDLSRAKIMGTAWARLRASMEAALPWHELNRYCEARAVRKAFRKGRQLMFYCQKIGGGSHDDDDDDDDDSSDEGESGGEAEADYLALLGEAEADYLALLDALDE